MLNKCLTALIVFGVIIFCLEACSPPFAPEIDGVVSIQYVSASPQFGSQTLTVDSSSIRYIKYVPNYPPFSRDTVVQDSVFLVATLTKVNMVLILLQNDAVDPGVLRLDGGYSIMTIIYRRKSDLQETTKIVKYTDPPPSSLLILDHAMVEKLIQIHDN